MVSVTQSRAWILSTDTHTPKVESSAALGDVRSNGFV